MVALVHLVHGEFAKLRSTRLWLWLLLATMGLTALFASLNIAFNNDPDTLAPPLATAAGQRLLFGTAAGGAQTLVAVLAAIGMAGEYRHGTATTTFLATPHRGRVVAAKLITYALVGMAFAVACIAVVAAIGWPWLSARGIDLALTRSGIPATMAGVVAAVAAFALLGVGLGALLRDQVAAVVGLLVYLFVAEPILTRIPALQDWTVFLPGPSASALTGITLIDRDFLLPWQGGVVLVGYALIAVALGLWRTTRIDLA
jgi:ABC-type transport system involved in multi-copper enzyme maturation permease subunit